MTLADNLGLAGEGSTKKTDAIDEEIKAIEGRDEELAAIKAKKPEDRTKEEEARLKELQAGVETDDARFMELHDEKKTIVDTEKKREDISKKLRAGESITAKEQEELLSGLTQTDEFQDILFEEDEGKRKEGLQKLEAGGQSRRSLIKGLSAQEADVKEQIKGTKEDSNERAELNKKLESIMTAKDNVQDHFGDEETGGLFGLIRDLLEKFDEFLGKHNKGTHSGPKS
jgi:hypothetical protein